MADEEVKIRVSAESDTAAIERTKAKIHELRVEAEDLRKSAAKYAEKYGFEDSRATSARSDASAREREANRMERPFIASDKQEQKAARDEKAKHLREQRAEDRAAAADERAVKRDMHQEETRRQRFGRGVVRLGTAAAEGGNPAYALSSLLGGAGGIAAGIAGVAAIAGFKIADAVITDQRERQGIALRDQAARRMNQYDRGVRAGVRGTSGQAQSEEDALARQIEERDANRAELERKGRRAWYNPLRLFNDKTWEGQRNIDESDIAQKRDKEELEKARAQKRDKFENEEGGLALDALRQRSQRTQLGQRAAFMDEYLAKALATKRSFREAGATPAQQNEAAQLEITNSLRDRQIRGGASLVDARSGAGDIAAAARWGGQTTPGEAETVKRLEQIIGKMDKADQTNNRTDHTVK